MKTILLAAVSCFAVVGCGGGGSVTNQNIGGLWNATLDDGDNDNYSYTMLTTENGQIAYTAPYAAPQTGGAPTIYPFDVMVFGSFSISGRTLSGSAAYAPLAVFACEDTLYCQVDSTFTLTGSISQFQTLTVNNQTTEGPSGGVWTYNTLYNNPSSLSAVAGTWSGNFVGSITDVTTAMLIVAADGSFTEQDAGTNCMVSGQINLIDPNYNAYSITWSYSGSDCEDVTSATGIAYIDYSVEPIALNIFAQTAGSANDIVGFTESPVTSGSTTSTPNKVIQLRHHYH